MVGPKGRIQLINVAAQNLFGYGHDELYGEPIEMLVPQEQRAAHRGHRAAYAKDRQSRQMGSGRELFGQRKDGSQFPVEIGLSPVDLGGTSFTSRPSLTLP